MLVEEAASALVRGAAYTQKKTRKLHRTLKGGQQRAVFMYVYAVRLDGRRARQHTVAAKTSSPLFPDIILEKKPELGPLLEIVNILGK